MKNDYQDVVDETLLEIQHMNPVIANVEDRILGIIENTDDPEEAAREIIQYIADNKTLIEEIWEELD